MSSVHDLFTTGPRLLKPYLIRHKSSCTLSLAVLALSCFLSACGTVSKSAVSTSSPGTYSISGTISPAAAGSGAALTLSGPSTANATADSSGNYSFIGLVNGTYVVTPTHSGFTFSPTLQTVTINGTNATSINFSGSQQAAHSVGLSWNASTTTVSGYNVYRGTTNGGPYSKINSGLISALSYTDTSVSSGNTYYYVSTSVDSSGVESVYSDQATAIIP